MLMNIADEVKLEIYENTQIAIFSRISAKLHNEIINSKPCLDLYLS